MSMFGADIAELEEQRLERRSLGTKDLGGPKVIQSGGPAVIKPKFCTQCGHTAGAGKFCVNCGKLVDSRLSAEPARLDPSEVAASKAGIIVVPDLPPAAAPTAAPAGSDPRDAELKKWNQTQGPVASPVPADHCAGCFRPLDGEVISALKLEFHSGCFKCWKCKKSLNGIAYKRTSPTNPKPICVPCYEAEQTPTCSKCKKPITNAYVEKHGLLLHPTCQ